MVYNCSGRDYIFYTQLQKDYILIYAADYVMIKKIL